MKFNKLILTISALLGANYGYSQMLTIDASRLLPAKSEEISQVFLIHEPVLEEESKPILSKLYNFEFEEVEKDISKLRLQYPGHPVSYFMESLISWWQILGNPDMRDFDDSFVQSIDKTIEVADQLLSSPQSTVEASFFLSASYGLKSQFMMKRRNWTKSAVAGRNSMNYLEEIKDKSDLSKEVLFGAGLFNYYVEYLPEAYPLLRPITALLPNGDKELGKQQLLEVYKKASYTKIEAAVYLIEILNQSSDEDQMYAIQMLNNLVKQYPNNPYFKNALAKQQ